MIRYRRLLLVAATVFALGVVVTTGAFTGGDQAASGVYLNPAETDNGQRYASLDSAGQLAIEVTNLNAESTSTIDSVFTVHTTRETTELWIEDGEPAVTFYRMDTGAPIESEDDAIALVEDETAVVGLEVETGTERVVLERITVHAAVPDSSDHTTPETETATDTATERVETPTEGETTKTETTEDEIIETETTEGETTETETATDTATERVETPTEDETTETETTETVTATPVDAESRTPTDSGGVEPTETPPAQIEVVSLETDPANPRVGQQITVRGILENVGGTERTITLELRADGEVIASERVTLAPGERGTITGTITVDQAGAYEIALANSSTTVSVSTEDDSLVETGGLTPSLLVGLLAVLAGFLLLAAYRRRDDEDEEPADPPAR